MKIEKNKIVFALVLLCLVLFIGAYSVLVLGEDEEPSIDSNKIPIPELEGGQKEYKSKLEALDDLKEERESNAPSVYDERLLDSMGVYDPDLLDKEKLRIVDSIYKEGKINYTERSFRQQPNQIKPEVMEEDSLKDNPMQIQNDLKNVFKDPKTLSLVHQLFFASSPKENEKLSPKHMDSLIYVRVDGTQIVQTHYRLQMQLLKDTKINNIVFPKNTPIYGFVSFKPNRTIIEIESINHQPVNLNAFDLQDGSEGIYIENSFRSEATQEVLGDMVDDVNLAGLPQVSGVKRIFQRHNRNVKVTIIDNYKLLLKPIP